MLSVVVPAYNEAARIERCLEALLPQLAPSDEVVVVDNNSTDATRVIVTAIARDDPRVRVIDQTRQGLVPTRDAGVAAAANEIVARIDADTVVSDGWAAAIKRFFAVVDDDIAGGHGFCAMYDMPFQSPFRSMQARFDRAAGHKLESGRVTELKEIFGANQVLRKHVWTKIADKTLDRTDIMEDSDVSIAVRGEGFRLALVPGMRATISGRRLLSSPAGYREYTACSPRTYRLHGRPVAAAAAWVGIQFARAAQTAVWVGLRGWDPQENRFRWGSRAEREPDRVVP